nr:hypothetical protein [Tanacetum cinerariifolium]
MKYPPFENLFNAEVISNPFLDLPFPMADDQPVWANNRAVAPTPAAAIVAVDLGDNFNVKGHHLSMIKDRQFDGRARADPHKHIIEFIKICDMFQYANTNADSIKLKLFPSSIAGDVKTKRETDAANVGDLNRHQSVTKNQWEDPKKKLTMPTEDIEDEMIDHALWEVIENGATLPKTKVVECVTTETPITTAEEKAQRRLEEKLSQEDVNQKLLRSLSPEWNTHVVVWRNKADLDTMSMDDLYNNLNMYEPEVKGMSSSSSSTQNMAFVSSLNNNTSNTNGAVNTAHGVSTASTQVNAAFSINIDNLSDAVICSLFASQPNSPQLVHEDLEQIHSDDMEKIDLRWQMEEEGPNYALMAFLSSNPESKIVDNCKKGLGYENYNVVPPPYTGNFMPSTPDLSFTCLDEFVNKPVVKNCKAMSSKEEPKDQGVIDSGCSRHMTRNMSYLTDYEEMDGEHAAFGGNPKERKSQKKNRFTWVLFLATKDETSGILKSFITKIENLEDHKVKVIRCDNGTEFKNREMNMFCEMKGILRQNRVARRRNRTLIEAAKTMLADFKLPTTFCAEAVNTACYVQNRVLVVNPHNKTPYKHFHGRTPTLNFMRPFGCPVTILNIIDHLRKFDGKADKCFFLGYSLNSKSFYYVFNSRTKIVEENLHIRFSESTPNVVGSGPDWLFDIDALTRTMNYEPIILGTQSNGFAGTKVNDNAGQARKEIEPIKDYILLPLWTADLPFSQDPKISIDVGSKPSSDDGKKVDEDPRKENKCKDQKKEDNVNITNNVNTVSSTVNAAGTN